MKRRRWGGWQASSRPFRTTVMGTLVVASAPAGCGLTESNADTGDVGNPDAGPDVDAGADAGHDASDVGGAGGSTIEPDCPLDPASDPFVEQAIAFPTGAPRRFFSWTTREQVDEFRNGETRRACLLRC